MLSAAVNGVCTRTSFDCLVCQTRLRSEISAISPRLLAVILTWPHNTYRLDMTGQNCESDSDDVHCRVHNSNTRATCNCVFNAVTIKKL